MSEAASEQIERRFDEVYRTLLTIASVMMPFSFNLYRDTLGINFFIELFFTLVLSILMWSFAHLLWNKDGLFESLEYECKLVAWHLLSYSLVISFARLITGQMLIPTPYRYVALFFIILPTYLLTKRFKRADIISKNANKKLFWPIMLWTMYMML